MDLAGAEALAGEEEKGGKTSMDWGVEGLPGGGHFGESAWDTGKQFSIPILIKP